LTAAAFLACPGKCLAIAVIYPIKGVAPRIVTPAERSLDRSSGHPSPIQQIKGTSHDRTLHVSLPRLSAWISQWKVSENKAGYTALLNDVPRRAHDCCRKTILL
jgi:hypothetical protein